jgi:hypothetical protein
MKERNDVDFADTFIKQRFYFIETFLQQRKIGAMHMCEINLNSFKIINGSKCLNVYALLSIKMRSRKINFYFFAKCEKKL